MPGNKVKKIIVKKSLKNSSDSRAGKILFFCDF